MRRDDRQRLAEAKWEKSLSERSPAIKRRSSFGRSRILVFCAREISWVFRGRIIGGSETE